MAKSAVLVLGQQMQLSHLTFSLCTRCRSAMLRLHAIACLQSFPLKMCRWRFPITCRGRPEFTEYMMKVLQGGVGDFPPILRPLHERSVDLSFIGCVRNILYVFGCACECSSACCTHSP